MLLRTVIPLLSTLAATLTGAVAGEAPTAVRLAEAGDVSTPAAAQATLDALAARLTASGGGTIVVDQGVAAAFLPRNAYQTRRDSGPAVTIIDQRKGYLTIQPPSLGYDRLGDWSGLQVQRTIRLPSGEGVAPYGSLAAAKLTSELVAGTSNVHCSHHFPASAGKDVRIYPRRIEGFFPGLRVAFGAEHQVVVKSLGWDAERRMPYVTADLAKDHPPSDELRNKHWAPTLGVTTLSNADNQSGMLCVNTRQYGNGDCFSVSAMHAYQGDIMSAGGDEGGVVFNAETINDLDPFHATVESRDPTGHELVFAPGRCNVEKLSMSRPLINLNHAKWVTGGTVRIVPPDDWSGFCEDGKGGYTDWTGRVPKTPKYLWQGRPYPSLIVAGVGNVLGGLIVGSADAPWDESVVGRYFAVDDPAETWNGREELACDNYGYMPFPTGKDARVHRWYRITEFARRPDGTKTIRILRTRWAAVSAGAPTLFRQDSYTWDGHERPLAYIIAPGAQVVDISRAWNDTRTGRSGAAYLATTAADPRTLVLAPNGDSGTRFDFSPGDAVLQAVGADPYQPKPLRIRLYDNLPTTLENHAITVFNHGGVTRTSGLSLGGGPFWPDQIAARKDAQPAWQTGISLGSSMKVGVLVAAPVTEAAVLMEQPGGLEQPVVWKTAGGRTGVVADPADGRLKVQGGALSPEGGLVRTPGISGSAVPARNLRGIDLAVPAGSGRLEVAFPAAEADATYAISVQPSWDTRCWTAAKAAGGFTIAFSTPAPASARVDWVLVR